MLEKKVRQSSGADMWPEILMMRRRPWSTGNFYSKGLRGSQLSHKDEGFALSDHKQTYGHSSYFKYALMDHAETFSFLIYNGTKYMVDT